MIEIQGTSITKRFDRQVLFKKLDFKMQSGKSYAVTGANGSGKSTLLQIIARIQQPSKGTVQYFKNTAILTDENIHGLKSYSGPLINPYDTLSGEENLAFCSSGDASFKRGLELLEYFDIITHRARPLKHYSSGMKQRLKLVLALCNNPGILFLDEPSMFLDNAGREKFFSLLADIAPQMLLVIATNEEKEKRFCTEEIHLGP